MALRTRPALFLAGIVLSLFALLQLTGGGEVAATPAAGETIVSAGPRLWVTPLELDFGPVGVGATSATQSVRITNTGDVTLTNFAGGGPTNSQFGATQNCASGVAPGAFCQYNFTFKPTAVGAVTATSNSSTNAGPFTITLRGTGVGPNLTYSPRSLDFGSVYSGTTTAQQAVTIRNTGLATLTNFAGGAPFDPQFHATQNCAGGVAPGGSCQYFFTFTPASAGTFTSYSSSSTNGGPIRIDLQGRGRTFIFPSGQWVTPRSIDFGPVPVGTMSPVVNTTITNQSIVTSITNWAGGGVLAPFNATQSCAGGVAPGNSCTFNYRFSPTAVGVFTTTSNVSNSFGSFSVELRGTGVGPSQTASPLWLDFGPVPIGVTSSAQTVTIRNTGPITLSSWAGGGVAAPFSASQNCAGGVAPGGSCQFFYTFTPQARGQFTAVSSFSTNAGPITIRLQGGAPVRILLPFISRG